MLWDVGRAATGTLLSSLTNKPPEPIEFNSRIGQWANQGLTSSQIGQQLALAPVQGLTDKAHNIWADLKDQRYFEASREGAALIGSFLPNLPGLPGLTELTGAAVSALGIPSTAKGAANAATGAKLAQELTQSSQFKPNTQLDAYYTARTDHALLKDNHFDLAHVLPGEINPSGKATGFHAEDAAQGASRITPGADIKQNSNGTYEAPVQLFDDKSKVWVDKPGIGSTFFPKDWSEARIKFEASEAFKVGKINGLAGTRFIEISPSGIPIQFNWDPRNKRTTFYPLKK
jgi:hypothetical protein